MSAFDILTSPVAFALTLYVVVAILLNQLAHPIRLKLVDSAEEFLREKKWNAQQRDELNLLLDTCMSFRVGLLVPVGVVSIVIDETLRRPIECSPSQIELSNDPRFDSLLGRYFVSIAAANPIAAVVSVILMALGMIITVPFGASIRSLMEWPVLRASAGMAGSAQVAG
jgi:hypothetical protein